MEETYRDESVWGKGDHVQQLDAPIDEKSEIIVVEAKMVNPLSSLVNIHQSRMDKCSPILNILTLHRRFCDIHSSLSVRPPLELLLAACLLLKTCYQTCTLSSTIFHLV